MKTEPFMKKELKDLLTDKVFLISIMLQFTIISALIFLFVFYSSITNTSLPVTVQLDKYDPNLVSKLVEAGVNVEVKTEKGIEKYTSNPTQGANRMPSLRVTYDTTSSEVKSDASNVLSGYAISKIRDATEKVSFEESLQAKGLDYGAVDLKEGNFAFLPISYGILIPIAIILPAFIVMGFTLQGILVERKTKVIELILVSPLTDFQIAQVKVVPFIAVSTILSIIWLLYISARVEILNLPLIALVAAFFSIITVSLSTIISATSSSVKEANAISSLSGMAIPLLGILPYNPFSNYFPTVIMARVASTHLNGEILATIAVFGAISLLFFYFAILAIRRMRVNFS